MGSQREALHLRGKQPYLFFTVLRMPCTQIHSIFIPILSRIQPILERRPGNTNPRTSDWCASAKKAFLRMDRARFRTNSIRSLFPVLLDLPCLLCLSSLASGAPGRPTFLPPRPTRLLRPHPLRVPPPCIRPLNLFSTGLLPTPCSCPRPAAIFATLPPLAS